MFLHVYISKTFSTLAIGETLHTKGCRINREVFGSAVDAIDSLMITMKQLTTNLSENAGHFHYTNNSSSNNNNNNHRLPHNLYHPTPPVMDKDVPFRRNRREGL